MSGDVAALEELLELYEQLERRKLIYKAEYYEPYDYQKRFHFAKGYKTDKLAIIRVLMAANQIGKSFGACMEDSYHLTGQYPDWWEGHRFSKPVTLMVAGETNESVRDILQKELFGDPTDPKSLGTGTVPIDMIGKIARKAGIVNAFDNVRVMHVSGGWSTAYFRAYEQGAKKFMGTKNHVVHADEEPPEEIWEQMTRSIFSVPGAICYATFTPENGMTKVVDKFMNNLARGQALINAGWSDAKHMTNADGSWTDRANMLAGTLSKSTLDMRTKGVPLSGEGLVLSVPDEQIVVPPFEIPKHWARLNGIDFGWDHPFGAASLAYDRDKDCIYLTAEYSESRALPAIHAQAIRAWGEWIPIAWPHDGLNTEKGTGDELIKQYRDVGLNCLPNRATNPPKPGMAEGTGGNSLEASVMDMVIRMETGRFKVFSTCVKFLNEKKMYHRKNGMIVKLHDDIISACRYGCMMIRHAKTEAPKAMGRTDTTRGGTQYMSARPNRRAK
jgi:phage terminase large subunit-like protein